MKGSEARFLDTATTDILQSAITDLNLKLTKDDLIDSEAYVLLHRDNPETKEVLGSVNLRLPFVVDDETKKSLDEMNVPTKKVFLTCFGVFDASNPDLDISIRCNARNEHGFPLSYTNASVMTKVQDVSDILTETIKREIKEDIEQLKLG